jgi:ATP-binding cassette subfamily B multidrug efflux pump
VPHSGGSHGPWHAPRIRDSNWPVVSDPQAHSDVSTRTPWTYLNRYRGKVTLGIVMLVATNVLFLAEPILIGRIVDILAEGTGLDGIPLLAMLLIGFALATAVTRILSRVYLFNTAREAEYDLRSDMFAHLLRMEPAFYRKHSTGDVLSRLSNDVQTVRALWGPGLLNLSNTAVAFVTVLLMMVRIDPLLTLLALVPYPSMFLLGKLFGKRLYRFSGEVQAQLGKLSSAIQEDMTGIGVIKSYVLESPRLQHFTRLSERLLGSNMELTKVRSQLAPALMAVSSVGTVIVIWWGARGDITPGQLAEFLTYLGRLVWPTLALGWMLSLVQRGMASWKRLHDIMLQQPSIQDGPGPDLDLAEIRGDIELRGLTIEIDGQKLLDDVHLKMPAGTVTAIVGRTGAGKSTLIEALPRLIDVPRGTVFLDDRDITELSLGTLRRAIGYAPQEAFLFSTTIARNIAFGYERYGNDDRSPAAGKMTVKDTPRSRREAALQVVSNEPRDMADAAGGDAAGRDPRMIRAAAGAGLTRDLEALPAGYDTVVGERGITLSGGQRQRVALARALAASPRVLILDDSLSSVDSETEREILGHLTELMANRTAILISHRVAAVKRAHRIVVLDQGKVVEAGTHDELLDRGGLYAEVYRSQLAHEEDVAPDADAGDPGAGSETGGARS